MWMYFQLGPFLEATIGFIGKWKELKTTVDIFLLKESKMALFLGYIFKLLSQKIHAACPPALFQLLWDLSASLLRSKGGSCHFGAKQSLLMALPPPFFSCRRYSLEQWIRFFKHGLLGRWKRGCWPVFPLLFIGLWDLVSHLSWLKIAPKQLTILNLQKTYNKKNRIQLKPHETIKTTLNLYKEKS